MNPDATHGSLRLFLVGFALAVSVVACAQPPLTCAQLPSLDLPELRILAAEEVTKDAAEEVTGDDAAAASLPAHCKVSGVIGSEINFELLLPADWNGKFVMGGGGGFVGSVQNQAQTPNLAGGTALEKGYATAGTDTGHSGSTIEAGWALDNQERELDFGYRAVHRTTDAAKQIIRTYYDGDIAHSYFMGCSRGGGQAMVESQRYPADFDGIIAGVPIYNWNGQGAAYIHELQAIYPDPNDLSSPVITAANRALLQSAILDACDSLDGLADGLISDPRSCPFTTASLPRCRHDVAAEGCVTQAQLAAIDAVYDGLEVDGKKIFPGFPFGDENDRGGWDRWITGGKDAFGPGIPSLHFAFGTQMYKYLVFDDPDWDYSTYDFSSYEQDTARAASFLNATSTDLSDFKEAGGKLIMWHGWSDPALTALATIDYYEAVETVDTQIRDYYRLFLMPGVLHCGGGSGPSRVDWLRAIETWVEEGKAPDSLLATHVGEDRVVDRSRPLCPYPQVAVYGGSGSPDEAASFSCRNPVE
ncbi:MAG: tannase/feruloyl esterase family alpha/beta hydrolase [Acidobacteriota bacterium]